MTTCYGQHPHQLVAGPFFVSETFHRPGLVLPKHEHETCCFHCVLEGEYTEETSRQSVSVGPRESLFKPAELSHWNRFGESGSRTLRIEFQPDQLVPLELSYPTTVFSTPNPAAFELSRRILREIRTPDAVAPMVVEGLSLEVIALLLRGLHRAETRRADLHQRVQECAEFLRSNFHESFTLSALAVQFEVNRTQLATAFRKVHGVTMGEYLRTVRVRFVTDQLDSTDRPLAEVALAAGFSDQSHCTRSFKRIVGTTPAAWRTTRSQRQSSNS